MAKTISLNAYLNKRNGQLSMNLGKEAMPSLLRKQLIENKGTPQKIKLHMSIRGWANE